jgi:hypothetical protein
MSVSRLVLVLVLAGLALALYDIQDSSTARCIEFGWLDVFPSRDRDQHITQFRRAAQAASMRGQYPVNGGHELFPVNLDP